jgi:peptide/nickel transport system permease protein
MTSYLLKRLVLMIPTMLVVSLLAFFISHGSPIDPIGDQECGNPFNVENFAIYQACREQKIRDYHLDKPAFYFQLTSWANPGDLHLRVEPSKRAALERLLHQNGNWELVRKWELAVQHFISLQARFVPDTQLVSPLQINSVKAIHGRAFNTLRNLPHQGRLESIKGVLRELGIGYQEHLAFGELEKERQNLLSLVEELEGNTQRWKNYLPRFYWYGLDNQYHIWLSGVLRRGDFGKRIFRNREISAEIGELFGQTAVMALLGTFCIFLIGIPWGILTARKRDGAGDRISAVVLFAFRALPEFWLGTVLLMLLANPDFLNIFPSSFNLSYPNPLDNVLKYVLPLVAYSYGSLALVSRTVRTSMLETLNEDYVRTARVKGLSEKTVLYRHALRNALLPMITLSASLFPALLSGAVILETVFEIPGMGREIFAAMNMNDMPFLLAIFTLMGFLTMMGYLVADLLYAWLDPRIRFHNQS